MLQSTNADLYRSIHISIYLLNFSKLVVTEGCSMGEESTELGVQDPMLDDGNPPNGHSAFPRYETRSEKVKLSGKLNAWCKERLHVKWAFDVYMKITAIKW